MQNRFLAVVLTASITLAACSRESADQTEQATEERPAASSPAEEPARTNTAQASNTDEVSVDDIDRWQRGMEAELQATREAAAKLAQAKDDNEKLEALQAATQMGTIDAGADAAGVDRDRYRRIRNHFSNAVSQLSPIEMEMDVSQMPAEMVEQMKQARAAGVSQLESQLPADVLETLKARAAELRQQDKNLVAERLKVAMSAR
jgi:hypothetical protein